MLEDNLLEEIKAGLFSSNTKLTSLHLNGNKIAKVDRRFLDNVENLLFVNMLGNVCVDIAFGYIYGDLSLVLPFLEDCFAPRFLALDKTTGQTIASKIGQN